MKKNEENSTSNILDLIAKSSSNFSAAQRDLAKYILENYKQAAFMNSTQLAEASMVSNPTVIRFSKLLGYPGYPEMQRDLQIVVQNELSSIERVYATMPKVSEEDDCPGYNIFKHEMRNIADASKVINSKMLKDAAELLMNSYRIFIVGSRVSAFYAEYAEYTMLKIHKNVYHIKEWTKDVEDKCFDSFTSIALVIAMPRYPNSTIELIKKLHKCGIHIILITDSVLFPCSNLAKLLITVPIRYYSYLDPLAPLLCTLNGIMVEMAYVDKEKTDYKLNEFEKFADENGIFFKKK